MLEVGYGVDGVGLLQIAFQFLKQLLLLGEVAHDMHLVVLGVEAQLFPHVKQEIEGIVGMTGLETITELKTVLLETENIELFAMEITIELATTTCETALVQMVPYGCHSLDELDIVKAVGDHPVQILVDGKETYRIQVGQHVIKDLPPLLTGRKTVTENRLHLVLAEPFDRNEHRGRIEQNLGPTGGVGYQFGQLQSLAEISRQGDAAFDDIGFKDNGALPVGSVCMRKGKRALSNADDDSLLARYFHFGCKVTNNFGNCKIIRNFVAVMIHDELKYRILQTFGFVPTPEQDHALDVFSLFMTDREEHAVMILRGSAGTGKTTLAGAIVRAMTALKQKLVLLAPTGRAAKVFSLYAGHPAYTIHRRIYRQKSAGDLSAFSLNINLGRDTLFIVDEASMIANQGFSDTPFGSGCLLDDLMQFVYNGQNCRMVLIGDKAQLPPVGEEESPALMAEVLRGYGMKVYECDLNQVLRQSQESGILWNATKMRGEGREVRGELLALPKIRLQGFADIQVVTGDELIESLATSYSRVGMDETMVITRSNKRANIYNQGIRNTVLDREDELCRGDQLMIVKNNYYWGAGVESISFLANGDIAVVQRCRNVHELYGFRFAEVTMQFPDYDDFELTSIVCLDTLTTEAPALTHEQHLQLYNAVMEDYADIRFKADRIKKLKSDKYYNALQIKYAYAVTCHKAQGGQWAHVYLDQGYMTDDMLTPDYIHWLYTAFTRATEKLFLVNWPTTQKQ